MTPTWTEYLNALEAAVLDVEASLHEGRTPQVPTLTLPVGAPPASSEPRRGQLEKLLTQVSELLAEHLTVVAGQLADLPRPRRIGYQSVASGELVDIVG